MAAYEKYEKTFTAEEIADALVSMGETSVPDEWRYLDNVRIRLDPIEEGQRDPETVGVRVTWWLDGRPRNELKGEPDDVTPGGSP